MRVAFIGGMMSGKTTAAHHLVSNYGFTRMAFADPVKFVAAEMLNTFEDTLREYYHYDLQNGVWTSGLVNSQKGHPTMRKMLQLVGTELGREYLGNENLWVDLLVNASRDSTANLVVDDCRFPNEYDALEYSEYRIIRISRPEEDRIAAVQAAYPDRWEEILAHPSETSLQNVSVHAIIEASSVKELLTKVNLLMKPALVS